ncbi:MAG: hypothetical protein Q4C91_01530 [Eubacteriales bacterium]|nr:hypothetical protein [Eubacteriales bacterium]
MGKEIKICLPFYKMAYSVFFVVILCILRGVIYTNEVGVALEAPLALLAAAFCADTYVQEVSSKRSEIERLYPIKNRTRSILKRMIVQEGYLFLLAAAGYVIDCVIQRPLPLYGMQIVIKDEIKMFFVYLAAIAVTLIFWGILSHTLSCLFRNMWAGIGCCLLLWITTNSTVGDRLLGKWNVFSYTFRNIENNEDLSWICGKTVCVLLILIMGAVLPEIIKKRG